MPDLSSIEFWPATGHQRKPWVAETEVDAWVKSSRRVCELYGEALKHVSLPSRVKGLRLMPGRGPGPDVVVHAFATADFEGARIEVPASVRNLTPLVRARLVLDATDLVLRELAAAKGWPSEAVAETKRRVLASGLHFKWEGRTVAARDRRRAARTRFWLCDDGFGRVQVELLDRVSGQVIRSSAALDAYSTVESFARTSKSLRWLDAETLTLINVSDGFGLFEESTVLKVTRDFQSHPRLSAQLRPRRVAASARVPVVVTA
ncbi:hypothetical protein [Microlunatus flavus]|nr:hypothetical protein [Microlunatus flavus]